MSGGGRALSSEHAVATAAVASALVSPLAAGVTLYVAYVQDQVTERQSQYSRALGYAEIYFSDPVGRASDPVDATFYADYDIILQSRDPNDEVAHLLSTRAQELAFDKVLAMYEQIATCANTNVCSPAITGQLYCHDLEAIYNNCYGYIVSRLARLGAPDYGCQVAKYLPTRNRLVRKDYLTALTSEERCASGCL
jgi:hypothetical protein